MGDEHLYDSSHLVLSNLLLQNSGAKRIPHSNAYPCDDGPANYTPRGCHSHTYCFSTAMWSTTHSNGEAFNSIDMNKVKHILCASSFLSECFAIFFLKQVKRIAFERLSLLPRLISPGLPFPVCKYSENLGFTHTPPRPSSICSIKIFLTQAHRKGIGTISRWLTNKEPH